MPPDYRKTELLAGERVDMMTGEKTRCLNCEAEILGSFCHVCGQKQEALLISVGCSMGEALDELFSIDGKLLRSLGLLIFKPGSLSLYWARGRRAHYVRPLRLYMFCAFLFFFLWPLLGDPSHSAISGALDGFMDAVKDIEESPEMIVGSSFDTILNALPTVVVLAMVPIFAAMTGLVSLAARNRGENFYVRHLVFSLHCHSVAFLALIAAMAVPASLLNIVFFTVIFGLGAYMVVALRTAYKLSFLSSLIWGSFMFAGYLFTYGTIVITVSIVAQTIGASLV